jgi:hypothetical protein
MKFFADHAAGISLSQLEIAKFLHARLTQSFHNGRFLHVQPTGRRDRPILWPFKSISQYSEGADAPFQGP